uniref:Uncharacterized protein n=1 Tax=Anguilla anguilla TaxID=7936 RepID=A0A0E9P7Y6_ANGAN
MLFHTPCYSMYKMYSIYFIKLITTISSYNVIYMGVFL